MFMFSLHIKYSFDLLMVTFFYFFHFIFWSTLFWSHAAVINRNKKICLHIGKDETEGEVNGRIPPSMSRRACVIQLSFVALVLFLAPSLKFNFLHSPLLHCNPTVSSVLSVLQVPFFLISFYYYLTCLSLSLILTNTPYLIISLPSLHHNLWTPQLLHSTPFPFFSLISFF